MGWRDACAPTNDMRVFMKTINGTQRDIGAWLGTAIPHLMGHYQVGSADRVAILCRHQHSARLVADHLGLTHHLFEESPFATAPLIESSLFADLLRLRYNEHLTAEPLVEMAGAPKLSPHELRALRRVVLLCRTCEEEDLVTTLMEAATRLLGRPPSPAGAIELGSVCGDAGKLAWFQSPSVDAVQIMTLHKAKGLEFDLVFHADLYDHVIPTRLYPPGTFDQLIFENEKQCLNLHYVGITRAVKACILMTSTFRINRQGENKKGAPSQFIGRNGTSAIPITW